MLKGLVAEEGPVPEINLVSKSTVQRYDVTQDPDMTAILKDLQSHLTSLNSNLKDMKDTRIWINRAEESLSEILTRLGSSTSLNHVNELELL
jgi:CENP-Q, a CENPA-CAD centromere complex subunit